MNAAMIAATLRALVLIVGPTVIARGWATPEQVAAASDLPSLTQFVAGVLTVLAFASAIWSHRKAALVRAAARLPEVSAILAEPRLADRIVSSKVSAG